MKKIKMKKINTCFLERHNLHVSNSSWNKNWILLGTIWARSSTVQVLLESGLIPFDIILHKFFDLAELNIIKL